MDNQQPPLLARQPILDRRLKVIGYELLCRPVPEDSKQWQETFGDHATSEVMISAFNDIGLDRVTQGLPAFVNFTSHWLHNPPIFPSSSLIAEILEHIEATEENITALKRLKKLGYRVALDDYRGAAEQELLFPFVDIIKVDIRQLPALSGLADIIARNRDHQLTWLAEKVETQDEYRICLEAGCELFQGYFFSRPDNVYGKRFPDNQLAVLRLLNTLNNTDSRLEDIARIIKSDPQISYKLLKAVNSAAMGCAREITSIDRAIVIVGLNRLKSWASLVALGKLTDKPQALREQAVIRAHLCRSLTFSWPAMDDDTAFTVGLFSLLDAFFDHPLEAICDRLALPQHLRNALIRHEGDYGFILATSIAMEHGEWEQIEWDILNGFGVTPGDLEKHYLQALQIARELLDAV